MKTLDKLLEVIKSDPNFKYYQELEHKINNSPEIKQQIDELKSLQQEMVLAKEINKTKLLSNLEEKYQKMLKKIELIPGLLDYLELQQYYNNLIQNIKETIEKTANDIILK